MKLNEKLSHLLFLYVSCALLFQAHAEVFEKLDESWTVSINGQTAAADSNGSFFVPNVSAPDLFGPGGPGSSPDFKSDDFLRATAVRHLNGVTRYAFSDTFQIDRGGCSSWVR
jgi:hypothetical protein